MKIHWGCVTISSEFVFAAESINGHIENRKKEKWFSLGNNEKKT